MTSFKIWSNLFLLVCLSGLYTYMYFLYIDISSRQEEVYAFSLCPRSPSVRGFVTTLPVGLIRKTQCILPAVVIVAKQHLNLVDETG